MIRDKSNLAIGILLPIILILLFGYGISFDVENAKVAVVVEDSSAAARDHRAESRREQVSRPGPRERLSGGGRDDGAVGGARYSQDSGEFRAAVRGWELNRAADSEWR